MKKQVRNLLALSLLTVVLVAAPSCSSDDNNSNDNTPETGFVLNPNQLEGDIEAGQAIVLKNDKTYTLTGDLIVKNGATLTIEAGTIIEASGIAYIAVEQGGKIYVDGTEDKPVVMTSNLKAPGSWGGLVICGKAPINKVKPGETALAEVSELAYGGTDVNDDSGSIRYLRIEYSGYAYNSEKEFNGLSLFGVGNGTTIEYVQVHAGSDDGFEWFGGTVDANYLVSTSNEDDQFDWTEGWNGKGSNWYAKEGLGKGNRGIEADNNAQNRAATPTSAPTISNLTLVGLGVDNAGSENQAMKLREGTHGIFDNVYITGFKTGIDVQHDETLAAVGTGLKLTNVAFGDVTTPVAAKNTAGDKVEVEGLITENAASKGAGAGAEAPAWTKGWTVGL
ncbi:hypothetical protein K5I29_12710 [Flavobacterium agricola]|uniref:Lipoprotein n=1 Tax=Flavobacterium agricola TaxID=2870839 RepID=A0ABY6LZ62_9FLAO|nr:hypothetical protein [Flavobacterium agricola]UYW01292.1 hypothetical protein K5I29_12710 [Flavobacterium agricola]